MANNMMNRRPMNQPNMNRNSGGNNSSPDKSCEELLRAIAEADFFAQDLKLYLDTHP